MVEIICQKLVFFLYFFRKRIFGDASYELRFYVPFDTK